MSGNGSSRLPLAHGSQANLGCWDSARQVLQLLHWPQSLDSSAFDSGQDYSSQPQGLFRPLAFGTAGALTNVSVTAIATTASPVQLSDLRFSHRKACGSLRFPASESQPHLDAPVTQFASHSTERAGSTSRTGNTESVSVIAHLSCTQRLCLHQS